MAVIYSYNELYKDVCETASGVWNDIAWRVRREFREMGSMRKVLPSSQSSPRRAEEVGWASAYASHPARFTYSLISYSLPVLFKPPSRMDPGSEPGMTSRGGVGLGCRGLAIVQPLTSSIQPPDRHPFSPQPSICHPYSLSPYSLPVLPFLQPKPLLEKDNPIQGVDRHALHEGAVVEAGLALGADGICHG